MGAFGRQGFTQEQSSPFSQPERKPRGGMFRAGMAMPRANAALSSGAPYSAYAQQAPSRPTPASPSAGAARPAPQASSGTPYSAPARQSPPQLPTAVMDWANSDGGRRANGSMAEIGNTYDLTWDVFKWRDDQRKARDQYSKDNVARSVERQKQLAAVGQNEQRRDQLIRQFQQEQASNPVPQMASNPALPKYFDQAVANASNQWGAQYDSVARDMRKPSQWGDAITGFIPSRDLGMEFAAKQIGNYFSTDPRLRATFPYAGNIMADALRQSSASSQEEADARMRQLIDGGSLPTGWSRTDDGRVLRPGWSLGPDGVARPYGLEALKSTSPQPQAPQPPPAAPVSQPAAPTAQPQASQAQAAPQSKSQSRASLRQQYEEAVRAKVLSEGWRTAADLQKLGRAGRASAEEIVSRRMGLYSDSMHPQQAIDGIRQMQTQAARANAERQANVARMQADPSGYFNNDPSKIYQLASDDWQRSEAAQDNPELARAAIAARDAGLRSGNPAFKKLFVDTSSPYMQAMQQLKIDPQTLGSGYGQEQIESAVNAKLGIQPGQFGPLGPSQQEMSRLLQENSLPAMRQQYEAAVSRWARSPYESVNTQQQNDGLNIMIGNRMRNFDAAAQQFDPETWRREIATLNKEADSRLQQVNANRRERDADPIAWALKAAGGDRNKMAAEAWQWEIGGKNQPAAQENPELAKAQSQILDHLIQKRDPTIMYQAAHMRPDLLRQRGIDFDFYGRGSNAQAWRQSQVSQADDMLRRLDDMRKQGAVVDSQINEWQRRKSRWLDPNVMWVEQ